MALPWFPMYPTDFLVSTASLTTSQGWAYCQLLMYAWTNEGIPDDRKICSAMTRCDLSEEDWIVLRSRFVVVKGGSSHPQATLQNPRMERERQDAQDAHDRAVENGKRGAEAKKKRMREGGLSNPSSHPDSHPTSMAEAITITTTTTDIKTPVTPFGKGGRRLRRADLKKAQQADPNWVPF